jgi:hypothetical protein
METAHPPFGGQVRGWVEGELYLPDLAGRFEQRRSQGTHMPNVSFADAVAALQRRAATGRRELPAGFQVQPAADPKWITVAGCCLITDTEFSVSVRRADLENWLAMQSYAEEAFPYLSATDREFLLSGFSPAGWAQVFPPEDDE